MILLLGMLIFPVVVGLMVSYMLNYDRKQSHIRRLLEFTKRPVLILCHAHTLRLKKGQIALIDPDRCKKCLDRTSRI